LTLFPVFCCFLRVRAVVHASGAEQTDEATPSVMPRRRLINLGAATLAMVVSSSPSDAARADEFASPAAMVGRGRCKLNPG